MALKSTATTLATIQMRRGAEENFDPEQMTAGEWAVSTDSKKVWMCFTPGLVLRMATYEAFEEDMEEIRAILVEAQDIQAAIEKWNYLAESYAHGGTGKREGEDTDNAKYYSEQAKASADKAESLSDIGIMTTEKAGIGKPDGETIIVDEDGTMHSVGGGGESVAIATTETAGIVKPDGTTITITEDGTISAAGGAEGDFASKAIYGDNAISLGRDEGSAVGEESIAYGDRVQATAIRSVAIGNQSKATGDNSFSCGAKTTASGAYSYAGGEECISLGRCSFSRGHETIAKEDYSTAIGRGNNYGNSGDINYGAFIIGNANTSTSFMRSNCFRVAYNGNVYAKSNYNSSGADYAEFIKEWHDGNTDNEDRVGYFVTVKDGYLYKANEGDYIVGITSGNPSVVGNSDEEYYWRWERDEFNRIVYEEKQEMIEEIDESGHIVTDENTGNSVMIDTGNMISVPKQRSDYDVSKQTTYIERKDRLEWDYVGMVGVLPVRDDGTCEVGKFCKCADGGIATLAAERGFDTYMVIERVTENIVSVILK